MLLSVVIEVLVLVSVEVEVLVLVSAEIEVLSTGSLWFGFGRSSCDHTNLSTTKEALQLWKQTVAPEPGTAGGWDLSPPPPAAPEPGTAGGWDLTDSCRFIRFIVVKNWLDHLNVLRRI